MVAKIDMYFASLSGREVSLSLGQQQTKSGFLGRGRQPTNPDIHKSILVEEQIVIADHLQQVFRPEGSPAPGVETL